jgi:N-acylneuraminate cytidylyltransferase
MLYHEFPFAEVDVVALIQCTSPFLNAAFLAEAYSKMQTGKYDCVFSVTREYKLRWKKLPGMISDNLL